MTDTELKVLLDKNLIIVKSLEKRASMWSKGILLLSLIDVIFGVLAIFFTSIQVLSVLASATSLTTISICGKLIQISKIRQLEKSLEFAKWPTIAWFVNKYSKYIKENKKMKLTKSTALQKVLTTVLAVFGVGGVVVNFLPQFTSIAGCVTTIVSAISESIAVASGIWLSATSDKVKTEEELTAEKTAAKAKDIEKAKSFLAKIDEAKQLVNSEVKTEE